ncbi:hypothetical protein T12_3627 [Trichinella patagoniensis]|uniref:Uncharacterized protein n=1 Tax=Trichinella patagoniensis TaxID=990121 RepID=A0A0V0YPQ6_9BILA|nr:hypothetical protein T12_3627 [Trichinella patagoniensis]
MKKNRLAKTKKYCTSLRNFNEYLTIMKKASATSKFNHHGAVSKEFQMGCFPVTF